MSAISKRIVRELSNKEFRNPYKRARVRSKIAYQIRAMRKKRAMLQGKLADLMGKPQSTVSRFENEDYGKWTLETLLEISDAFDVGLVVEFVDYPTFMIRTSNLAPENLNAESYNEKDIEFLSREASAAQTGIVVHPTPATQPIIAMPEPTIIEANPLEANRGTDVVIAATPQSHMGNMNV